METNYLIPAGLAQAVIDYLSSRPFREVSGLIGAMSQLRPEIDPALVPRPNGKTRPKEAPDGI